MATVNAENYTVGGVDLYYDTAVGHASLVDTTGTVTVGSNFRTSGRNLGNIMTSEVAVDVTYLEHFINVNGKRRRDKVVSNNESLSIPFTFDEINEANLQKAFLGSNLGNNKIAPMQETVQRGSISLLFRTDVGNSFVYSIPKGTIRPDGNLSIGDGSDWLSQPMMIDVEYCSTTDHWASKPYGVVEMI